MKKPFKGLGLGFGINVCERFMLYWTTKNRDMLDLTNRWGDLIIYPVNIRTLMLELAKVKSTGI